MSKMHICNVINHNSISFVSFPYYTGEFGKVSLCRKYLSVFSGWYQIMIPSRESSYNRATLHIGEVVPKMLGQPPKSFLHISAPFQAQCEVLFRIYNVSSISYPPPKMIVKRPSPCTLMHSIIWRTMLSSYCVSLAVRLAMIFWISSSRACRVASPRTLS